MMMNRGEYRPSEDVKDITGFDLNDKINEINRLNSLIENNGEFDYDYKELDKIHVSYSNDNKVNLFWSKIESDFGGFMNYTNVRTIAKNISEKMANKTVDLILSARIQKIEEIKKVNLKHQKEVEKLFKEKE